MKRFLALLVFASLPAAVSAQSGWETSGRISAGLERVENNSNSSKFTEYRAFENNGVPFSFWLHSVNPGGLFLRAEGTDVNRADQRVGLAFGKPGSFRITALWDELPHDLSNKALSPYRSTTAGRLEVLQTMQITFKKLATAGADAPNVLRMDSIAAAYARQYSTPIDLENRTRTGSVRLRARPLAGVEVSAGYTQRTKTGSHLSYGPVGDRPPRTLNIQLAEPLDYSTGDFNVAAEYVQPRFQLRGEYLLSKFENAIDVLEWENVWASAPAGSTTDTWDRAVATWGRRPLAPDNQYQNVMFTGGVALPYDSRLTATVARGVLEQDAPLVPYAYHVDGTLVNKTLPRASAMAELNIWQLSAEYFITPLRALNVRAFYRSFDLDNETPSAQWQYVTQDAYNLSGTVSYVNKRQNEPISWGRANLGVETTIRLGVLNSSLTLGAEREDIDREHRQAEKSSEDILRASWRARPTRWVSLRAGYRKGSREIEEYDWRSPSESYWYAPTDANDNNDPKNSFEDHPDMRKFDMADRARDRYDLTVTLTPTADLSISSGIRVRKDDFHSDVTAVQPLRGLPVADSLATTPGDQLGLLSAKSRQLTVDVSYAPGERLALTASYGYDLGESSMKSIEFNENNKKNPSAVNTAMLGPWTRRSSQWTADFEDETRFAGFGASFEVVPGKVTTSANLSLSLSELDVTNGGFGLLSFDGTTLPTTHEFSFQAPKPVRQDAHSAEFTLAFPLYRTLGAQVGWTYESYSIRDWQQDTGTLQYESIGSDLFLRDTSRSHQWGNRLFNMGSYLAPSFTGHAVFLGVSYRFGREPAL